MCPSVCHLFATTTTTKQKTKSDAKNEMVTQDFVHNGKGK